MEKNSLVLYKHNPAIIIDAGDKIDILLRGGKTKKVRVKDIQLLHKGPVSSFSDLKELEGDIRKACGDCQVFLPDTCHLYLLTFYIAPWYLPLLDAPHGQ